MKRKPVIGVTVRLLTALAVPLLLLTVIYNPLQTRWGATDQEVARAMPGDNIQPHPIMNATRAITIDASPERIWPWLVQIGYKRAGWYGYDSLDNAGITSATHLVSDLQQMKVGDIIPIWEGVNYRVVSMEPSRYLVIGGLKGEDSMAFGLYTVDASHTRLVWRYRSIPLGDVTTPFAAAQMLTTVLLDFVAVRENMLGIKARAEGMSPPSRTDQNIEIGLWAGMLLAFLAAEVALVVRRDWLKSPLVATAVGVTMVGLVLVKPPTWIDGLVLLMICVALWWMYRPASRSEPKLTAMQAA